MLGRVIVQDRDTFIERVAHFPVGRLHDLARAADGHRDDVRTEPERRAAAIHRRVPAADNDDALADLVDMTESH